ncbi:glutathione S-transferase family protein [Pacificimonas flava]|uniref:Glutathione S-transferase n=1 Tax=Pacificimonas flava TaxID=1234595 RepID=M2TBJ8_9SPHN|nr:glutathione S-transferase family protein [Pacificimonas flava]EMD83994.1 Glutathione S-transferase [Pacificimonas flava]MBB5281033.1 glutathione S-transferase [Pacificimonas flava]
MITVHYAPQTRASRMFWLLEEIGEPYELERIDLGAPENASADFRAASPLGKVPALTDDKAHVADSAAICLYLADKYAPGTLAPLPDDPARGEFLTWLFFTPSVIEPAMSEKASGMPPQPTRNAWGSWDRMLAALGDRLEGRDYVAAGCFTVADLMIAGSLRFMSAFGMLDLSPGMAAYTERCFGRPAAQRAEERERAAG